MNSLRKSSVLLASSVLIIVSVVLSRDGKAEETFPELRLQGAPPSGFAYRLHDGPDFYVWYCEPEGRIADGSTPGFGIYFGLHAQPPPKEQDAHTDSGVVAGQPVMWTESRPSPLIRRETYLVYKHGADSLPLTLHVFVSAQSEEQLQLFLAVLKELRFVPR